MASSSRGGWVVCAALFSAACGEGAHEEQPDSAPVSWPDELRRLDRDLGPGAEGQAVRAVQQYLTEFGYFPNPEIARAHPRWRPVVPTAPQDGRYDEETTRAVSGFQFQTALPETGIVDAATRRLMQTPRCGFPDSAPEDPAEKYFTTLFAWTDRSLTWKLLNTDDGIPISQARAAVAAAFASWQLETSLTFTQTSAAEADIELRFEIFNPDPVINDSALADAEFPPNGTIRIDADDRWSATTPPTPGTFDLETVLLHEIGHALGLGHSGFETATMYPFISGTADRQPSNDDRVGISARYDVWQLVPGCAVDIGVSAGITGGVWVTGCDDVPQGHGIFQRQGATWVRVSGSAAAVRIAATTNGVWVVNSSGNVLRGSGTAPSLTWTSMPGCAVDVGSSATGAHVWIAACDGKVYKWNSATSTWNLATGTSGTARFIAVDTAGVPWITNSASQVLRRTSNSATSGGWNLLAGSAWDVGIGAPNYAWKLGESFDLLAGGFAVHVWNEQPFADGGPDAPELTRWFAQSGRGMSVSVEREGDPWIVDSAGRIFKRER